jgi:23S rRNA (cytidine1920-2'-O)/16S rRNA (cytidine1409-2'-O)-methyltransferase
MKERLDLLLVERRLVESRTKAQWLIKEGLVTVNGKIINKPGKLIQNYYKIELIKEFPYVGRGGLKLEAALRNFSILAKDKICVDIGASVGGFTDCLLKHGASKIYAIDTATDLLHPSLQCKPEMIVKLLGVDARNINTLPELIDLVTIDITFASLKSILPNVLNYLKKDGDIIVLIKPVFETNFYNLNKFDIILDPKLLIRILDDLLKWCFNNKIYLKNIMKSPFPGKGGSVEFLAHFKLGEFPDYKYENTLKEIII